MNELARRAVACEGWRWLPGMLATWTGGTEEDGPDDRGRLVWEKRGYSPGDWSFGRWYVFPEGSGTRIVHPSIPDFNDAATRGCLLDLVMAGEDQWEVGVHPDGGAFATIGDRTWTGRTLEEALVKVLEAGGVTSAEVDTFRNMIPELAGGQVYILARHWPIESADRPPIIGGRVFANRDDALAAASELADADLSRVSAFGRTVETFHRRRGVWAGREVPL